MSKPSTQPGFAPSPSEETDGRPSSADDQPFDPTTLRDVVVADTSEKLVARYRTDPRLENAPEMALLRGIAADKKNRGVVGFRDGLADAQEEHALRTKRDAERRRIAKETAAEVVAKKAQASQSVREPPGTSETELPPTVVRVAARSPVRRLVMVAGLVVLFGAIVFAIVGRLRPRGEATDPPNAASSAPAPSSAPLPRETAALPPGPTAAPSSTTVPSPTASSSAARPTKPKPAPPEPTKTISPPPPPGTAFDPMQGT